jgi:hypothetical protein
LVFVVLHAVSLLTYLLFAACQKGLLSKAIKHKQHDDNKNQPCEAGAGASNGVAQFAVTVARLSSLTTTSI